ncbi:sigma-70 family RNA polymerase sigma factor [Xenorhabdus sp. DI]|uniref:sigma-70 family RNA polymerase sigma factor n=1 Tax=Xenorhabdus doucetiae TaxID=351671 RepID=UPI00199938A2|nr:MULTISPECIES: sigma-70 family RNA polymerase sigma factor [unclassified Xenorhabdus]MBD2783719.1 sigma-70 family RNA polymerase sigma factor [Xenorhabdus sp. 3]MBD2790079.1 sigma-70 family RNA polymerase sigma factor [Xenorhabdus sp. DI]
MAVQKSTLGHNQITQQLYSDYHHWLCNWIRQNSACPNHAEDLAHEIFIKLMQSSDLETIRQPRAFLITLARRTLANHWRRKKLEDRYLESLRELPVISSHSSEHQLVLLDQLEKIDKTLDELPVKVRQAFLLTQFQGRRYKEVAEDLGISISSVKNYLHQAHRKCHPFNTL